MVGRAGECDLVIHSDRIARRHFAFERDGAVVLLDGDEIRVGDGVLRFELMPA